MSTEVIPEATVETPWHEGIYSPENPRSFVQDWHTKVPEDVRKDFEPYAKAKDPWEAFTLANNRVRETQKALHAARQPKGLPEMPADPADAEGMKAYYEARGLPVTPDGYGLKRPDGFPEQLYSDAAAKEWAKFFHDKGVSPDLVKEMTERQFAQSKQAYEAHVQAAQAQEAAEAKARADYIQSLKEGLHQEFGARADRELSKLEDLAAVSVSKEEAKAMFDPNQPDKYVGLPVIRMLQSLQAMNPKNGDPTARMMERSAMQGNALSWEAWKALPNTDDRVKAAFDPKHPNHAMMKKARDEAAAYHEKMQAQAK